MNKPAWSKITRWLGNTKNVMKLKRWYKKSIHRKNRRKNKQNPESQDKKLNTWEID